MSDTTVEPGSSRLALRRLLYGRDERRPRATWRVLLPLVTAVAIQITGLLSIGPLADRLVGPDAGTAAAVGWTLAFGVYFTLFVVAATGAALFVASRLDRRPLAAYGFERSRRWALDLCGGVLVGAATSVAVLGYVAARGHASVSVEVTGVGVEGVVLSAATLVVVLAFVLANNVYEEVLFRGIVIRNGAEGLRARSLGVVPAVGLAVAISLPLFGALHLLSGGLGLVLTSSIVGVLFAAGYVLTGRLALPIGVHVGGVVLESVTQETILFEGMTAPSVLVASVTDPSLSTSVEVSAVRVLVGVALVAAWVYATSGDLSIDERVYTWADSSE